MVHLVDAAYDFCGELVERTPGDEPLRPLRRGSRTVFARFDFWVQLKAVEAHIDLPALRTVFGASRLLEPLLEACVTSSVSCGYMRYAPHLIEQALTARKASHLVLLM
jgi:hypothetical protein